MPEVTGSAGGSAGPDGGAGFTPPPPGAAGEDPNPWFSIWTRPRATMRHILDTDPRRMVIALAAMGGIGSFLLEGVQSAIGSYMPVPLAVALCLAGGALGGIVGLYLFGFLVRVTGRWLGGLGDGVGVRAALAWSNVPTVWSLLLVLPWIALLGEQSFRLDQSLLEGNLATAVVALGLGLVQITIGVWALVISVKCLGEAHRCSAWRSLGALLLAAMMLAVPVVLIAILVVTPSM
jgi:Yip1-like protein